MYHNRSPGRGLSVTILNCLACALIIAAFIVATAAALLAAPLAAESAAADAKHEKAVMVRVVTRWNAAWWERCSASQRDSWDDMLRDWYDAICDARPGPAGHGGQAWIGITFQHNGNIVDSDFADSRFWWGNDNNKIDDVDVCMIGLHGGNNAGNHRWYGKVRVDERSWWGPGDCQAYQGHIELGDHDLEFLHLSSCYSMDSEDWWSEWNSSFDGLHQIDGFHGIMWISAAFDDEYEDFADDSFWISIADSWLDNLYIRNVSNDYDQCPVARNVGSNNVDSLNRMSNERYNNVFADPPGLGAGRNHRARYIRGCDPKGKGAL
jgi:hypothetical protein